MFLRKCRNSKTGRTQLSIVESYRRANGKPGQNIVLNIGYLDEVEKTMDDPIAYYTAEAERMTKEKEESRKELNITLNWNEKLQSGENNRKNFGYVAISDTYHEIGLDNFFNKYQRSTNAEFNINNIFKSLLFSRAMYPSSKHRSFLEYMPMLFEKIDFSEKDMYRCLDHIADENDHIQQWVNDAVTKLYGRDTSYGMYDLTNYFYEIDNEDDLRKRGVSKENRRLPIVQVGLLMDRNHIPIHMDIYPGNTHDSKILIPMVNKVSGNFGFKRTIFIADRGIITEANVCKVHESGNGYIFSYSVRKAGKEFKNYVLDPEGYNEWKPDKNKDKKPLVFVSDVTGQKDEISEDVFKCKSRIVETSFKDEDGVQHKYKQKQVVFYSPAYARKTKHERDRMIAKAESLIEDKKCDSLGKYGVGKYIATTEFSKATGEELKNNLKTYSIDEKKIAEDELYDGYYAIMSSEIEMDDSGIISGYKDLWHIEESFRITKSDLKTRPIFVRTKKHILAHFVICFVSLVILRILEIKLDGRFKASTILKSLRSCECTRVYENVFQFIYMDEVLEAIQKELGIDFTTRNRTLKSIKEQFTKAKSSSPLKIRRVFKRRIRKV